MKKGHVEPVLHQVLEGSVRRFQRFPDGLVQQIAGPGDGMVEILDLPAFIRVFPADVVDEGIPVDVEIDPVLRQDDLEGRVQGGDLRRVRQRDVELGVELREDLAGAETAPGEGIDVEGIAREGEAVTERAFGKQQGFAAVSGRQQRGDEGTEVAADHDHVVHGLKSLAPGRGFFLIKLFSKKRAFLSNPISTSQLLHSNRPGQGCPAASDRFRNP